MSSNHRISRKQLAALRKLLRQGDPREVRHGLALMEALEDTEFLDWFSAGVEVDPAGEIVVDRASEVHRRVRPMFRQEVALWALWRTGKLADVAALRVPGPCVFSDLDVLHAVSDLKLLVVGARAGAMSLDGLRACTRLERLRLATDDADLTPLRACVALRDLLLDVNGLLSDLSVLENCRELRTLHVHAPNLQSLHGLGTCTQLEQFESGDCASLVSLEGLEGCVSLRALELRSCRSLSDISALYALEHLESLDMSECPRLADLGAFASLVHLKTLRVFGTVGVMNLDALASLSSLEHLSLSYWRGFHDLSGVSRFRTLRRLDLTMCDAIESLLGLEGCPSIESVTLRSMNELTDISALTELPKLRTVVLEKCHALMDIRCLTRCPSLESVTIKVCFGLSHHGVCEGDALTDLLRELAAP